MKSEHILTSDFECTTSNKGNPFDKTNKAVCIAYKVNDNISECDFVTPDVNKELLTTFDLCIYFNAKFDLHWSRKLGYKIPAKVWCCQIAEFILNGQQERYPSLELTAEKYNLGKKLDVVKTEYWDKDICTSAIPHDILEEYAKQDVDLTYAVYLKQKEQFDNNPKLYTLFKLMMLDLLVLEEMEWNGLVYDEALCEEKAKTIDHEIQEITKQLAAIYPGIAINFNSGDQLSAFLYGGSIKYVVKEHVGYTLKDHKPKYRNVEKKHTLPQLIKPLSKSELKKEGLWATDEGTLRKLKGHYAKKLVPILLRLAELDKLNSTYYRGIPKINKEMNWPKQKLHGQFNQCTAATGRLSSSKPNLQNFANECLDVFVSRYDE